MTHTSGLRPYRLHTQVACQSNPLSGCFNTCTTVYNPDLYEVGDPGVSNELINAFGSFTQGRRATMPQVTEHIFRFPLMNKPGTNQPVVPGTNDSYAYGSYNHILLARIIGVVTGQQFNRYLKDKIFTPLSMTDSFFVATEQGVTAQQRSRIADITLATNDGNLPKDIAPPLVCDSEGRDPAWEEQRQNWVFPWPEGGMYSTANDLLRSLKMLKKKGLADNGQLVLTVPSVELLKKNLLEEAPLTALSGQLSRPDSRV